MPHAASRTVNASRVDPGSARSGRLFFPASYISPATASGDDPEDTIRTDAAALMYLMWKGPSKRGPMAARDERHAIAAALGLAGLSLLLLGAGAPPAQKTVAGPARPHRSPARPGPGHDDLGRLPPHPGPNWADPSLKPERGFKLAVVGIDFPDQPFVITLPKGSDPFGNPQIDPVPREKVAAVLRRLLDDAERRQPRPDHQRLLDGAVAGQVRHHRGRGLRPLPHAQAHLALRAQRVPPERPDARRQPGRRPHGARLRRALDAPTSAATSARTSTPSCASTRATTRRASGRSSAR